MKKLISAAAMALSAGAVALTLGTAPVFAASHGAAAVHGGSVSATHGGQGTAPGRNQGDPTGIHGTGSSDGWAGCTTYSWNC